MRIIAVVAVGLAAAACTPCGDWSKFNSFTNACHSTEVK
ncbi:hypothetical protein GGD83_003373 [Rhodoblastus sphagnicola]|nr:hypothetical protein [Rhodoblastus sphagnicola]